MPRSHPPPRRWIQEKSHFGNVERTAWRDSEATTDLDRGRLAAAKAQHRFARQVRVQAGDLGASMEAVARALGIREEALRRAIRGEAHLPPAHMHALAVILGIDLDIIINGKSSEPPTP